MIAVLSRKEILGLAFVAAGARGLTGAEMQREVGSHWRLRLRELRADGWEFREDERRVGKPGVFRWVLLYEPPAPTEDVCTEPEQLVLIDPSEGARPASALEAA